MGKAMAMATMTMTMALACEPEGACAADVDCAFGQMCGVEGLCVYASVGTAPDGWTPVAVAGDPMLDAGGGSEGGSSPAFSTTGVFDGTIGGAPVDEADVVGWSGSSGLGLTLTAAGRPSTFLVVQLPVSAFTTPGTSVRVTDGFETWAQACNYDSSSYDESFVDLVVEVSPPRASTPEDQIIAEDKPDEVIDVVVSVDGAGSTVTGAFTMPSQ